MCHHLDDEIDLDEAADEHDLDEKEIDELEALVSDD